MYPLQTISLIFIHMFILFYLHFIKCTFTVLCFTVRDENLHLQGLLTKITQDLPIRSRVVKGEITDSASNFKEKKNSHMWTLVIDQNDKQKWERNR